MPLAYLCAQEWGGAGRSGGGVKSARKMNEFMNAKGYGGGEDSILLPLLLIGSIKLG